MLSKSRDSKGFTLIELMIVVAIIGILAAIAIPNFVSFKNKAIQGTAKANLDTVRASLSQYAADKDDNGYPADGTMDTYTALITILSPYGLTFKPPSQGGVETDSKWASYVDYELSAAGYTVTITANDSAGTTIKAYLHGVE